MPEESQPRCYSYIRFSTPDQIKGDSLSRQLRLSQEYVKEKGLILDDSLKMEDRGLSAFSGKHRTHGALGKFLEAVNDGRVPPGSILLVESLDRLSRERVTDALTQFMEIINNGIKIVTLTDGKEYDKKAINSNYADLIISLTVMSRAFEESLQKSKRVAAAWESKRKNIDKRKLTGRCPAWLVLDKDKQEFKPIKDRVDLLKRIFSLSLDGVGIKGIAKKLNKEKISSWKKGNGWHSSYIYKILNNRSVLGEFQPHKVIEKKRQPDGEAIGNYFPQVIADHTFNRVQERLRDNASKGGKTGKISSLFGCLAKCGYCKAPMQLVDKGKPPKGGKYLICDKARRKVDGGCHSASFEYTSFELAFLNFCLGLDYNELLSYGSKQKKTEQNQIREELSAIEGELKSLKSKEENLLSSLEGEDDMTLQSRIKARLKEALTAQEALKLQKKVLDQRLNSLFHNEEAAKSSIDGLKRLIQFMNNEQGEKLRDLRLRLRGEIRQLIERIEVFPLGRISSIEDIDRVTYLLSDPDAADKQVFKDQVSNALRDTKREPGKRLFVIWFKNGDFRTIAADPEDSSTFKLLVEKRGKKYYSPLIP